VIAQCSQVTSLPAHESAEADVAIARWEKGLTPQEALQGMTVNAARALGLAHAVGSIAPGKQADLCVWRIESLSELGYWIGLPGPERRIFGGLDG